MQKIFVSEKSDRRLIEYLRGLGKELELVSAHANVASAISCHPDIYMCKLPDGIYVGEPNRLTEKYPGDVLYNAAWVGDYFLCSKYTDEILVEKAKCLNLKIIVLPQGYVKCNLVVVDGEHVITEDMGIAKVLNTSTDLDCLLVSSAQVDLPGYKYGFIGGASGRVDDTVIFNGNLDAHKDADRIKSYIESCNLKIKDFKEYKLTDIGSIITEFKSLNILPSRSRF